MAEHVTIIAFQLVLLNAWHNVSNIGSSKGWQILSNRSSEFLAQMQRTVPARPGSRHTVEILSHCPSPYGPASTSPFLLLLSLPLSSTPFLGNLAPHGFTDTVRLGNLLVASKSHERESLMRLSILVEQTTLKLSA